MSARLPDDWRDEPPLYVNAIYTARQWIGGRFITGGIELGFDELDKILRGVFHADLCAATITDCQIVQHPTHLPIA